MVVSEWMSVSPVTVTPVTGVAEALRLMERRGVRCLAVVEGDRPMGVVRREDLLRLAPSDATTLSRYEIPALLDRLRVSRILRPATAVTPETSLAEASHRLLEEDAGELLVIAGGRLQGILTRSDCLRGLLASPAWRAA